MIKRYSIKELEDIFSLNHKFETFFKVEIACTHSLANHQIVPMDDYKKIRDNAKFDLNRINEIEKVTHHDVIAFTRAVSESLGEEKKWVHYLLTSTDVVDTANGVIYQEANNVIEKDLIAFGNALKEKALTYKYTPCIGRTHGIHADITSFGLKFALYFDEFNRDLERFVQARRQIEIGKISGAVGNFANIPSYVQDDVCAELNIDSAKISTQVLQRDRHANYISCLCLISSLIEKIAMEIRLLQQTEIHEAEEYFSKGQKGSSAMPHKRNPISSENLCGCARMMRGYLISIFEDIPLWHERDISHSSVERVSLNDAIMICDYMLRKATSLITKLLVYPQRMINNIYLTNGVIFSQRVMTSLINKGLSREDAYDLVQPYAQDSYNQGKDFNQLLLNSEEIAHFLSKEEIESNFDLDYYLKNVDEIYLRVGIK